MRVAVGIKKALNSLKLLSEILRLRAVDVRLGCGAEDEAIRTSFNAPHLRLPLIRKKTLGVALIEAGAYGSGAAYLAAQNGKNSAAYFARKAGRAGYSVRSFEPNAEIDAIHEINVSLSERQGKPMLASHTRKEESFSVPASHRWYGVFSSEGSLVGYIEVIESGELAIINRILGHGAHLDHGVMYQAGTYTICDIIDRGACPWILYDTMYGASEGLKLFKRRLGFKAYRARWH